MSKLIHPYRSPAPRLFATYVAVVLMTIATFALAAGNVMLIGYVEGWFPSAFLEQPGLMAPTMLETLIYGATGLYFVVMLVLVVLSLMLIHRLTRNTYAMGDPTLASPAWAVGWWFVPIANLFKPYEHLKDLLHRSAPDTGSIKGLSRLLLVWWLAWVLYNIGSSISNNILGDPVTPEDAVRVSIFGSIELVISLPILWTYYIILKRVTDLQETRGNIANVF